MSSLTDAVKNLLIINVVLFIGTMAILGDPAGQAFQILVSQPDSADFLEWKKMILALFYPTSDYFQPYQLITHMFMHSDMGHLFFNMFGLYMFGPPIENYIGTKRFLIFYFAAGFGALILHMLFMYVELNYLGADPRGIHVPMLGASGAIFGLLAGFGTLFPNNRIMLLFPPIPMKAKYFVLIYAGIELFLGIGQFSTGIAHFAHLGGALFGFLLIRYWQKNGELWKK